MTKLSIIVPIYGVEQYLRKCVDSLLAQDLPSSEYEIILVDDESPDACPQICEEYAAQRCNISVVHRENGGLSAARNSGIEVAKGAYLMFVDSDDFIEPNVLSMLVEQIERDHLDVLRYKHQYVDANGLPYNPYKSDPYGRHNYSAEVTDGISFLNTRFGTTCYAWAFVVRRELFEDCIFTPGIYFEDTDWTPRMLIKAKRVASTNRVVYNYLLTRQGSITNATNRAKQKKVLNDKMRLVGELHRQADVLASQGKEHSWFGRMTADLVISIIGMLSTDFYAERKDYLARLKQYQVYPLRSGKPKARLINISPRLAVELLHMKNGEA
ncbi:MAG: glycosyltransferase [Paludibacteraceae bacterium]|nr:glycosyltransferase [Paludibacteraceae bacterium]